MVKERNNLEPLRAFQVIPVESADQLSKPQVNEQLSDSDLLRLSSKGDEEAFVLLYRRHQGPVFRFALHMSGCRDTAEEVTQDVFLALLADGRKYCPEHGPLEAYLIGVARNKVRRQLQWRRSLCDWNAKSAAEMAGESGAGLFNELNQERQLEMLRAAMLRLPPNYREVLVLCVLEDMDYAQAAARLGCPIGTVRSRLHRARGVLEARLRQQERCPA